MQLNVAFYFQICHDISFAVNVVVSRNYYFTATLFSHVVDCRLNCVVVVCIAVALCVKRSVCNLDRARRQIETIRIFDKIFPVFYIERF